MSSRTIRASSAAAGAWLGVVMTLGSAVAAAAPAHLEFVENDYARARAEARKRKVPLFIDAWALW